MRHGSSTFLRQYGASDIVVMFHGWSDLLAGRDIPGIVAWSIAALRDADDALENAGEIGQTATLMFALKDGAFPAT